MMQWTVRRDEYLPQIPRDVIHVIRDLFARCEDDKTTLLSARLVSKDWKLAVAKFSNLFLWCSRLVQKRKLGCVTSTVTWPYDLSKRQPFDLFPFLLEVLTANVNDAFWRQCGGWPELADLAKRMLHQKDRDIEKVERDAWFKICKHGVGEADNAVITSIFRIRRVDWLSNGVVTLLLCPAFRSGALAMLKAASRGSFTKNQSCEEITLKLLCWGVWCRCDNLAPQPGGYTIIKANWPDETVSRWETGTMVRAWATFVASKLHMNPDVAEMIVRVKDPEFPMML